MATLAEVFAGMYNDWDGTTYPPEEFEYLVDVVMDPMEDGLDPHDTAQEICKFEGGNDYYLDLAEAAFDWYVASNNPYK